jgi:endonuclease/exonuclease/phosphatase family metal-dependent hydrolase
VIVGDLNVRPDSPIRRCGDAFRRILESGWQRASPVGPGGFMKHGRHSEIDHLLASSQCGITNARYLTTSGGFRLAGAKDALSDHAALIADVVVCRSE